MCLEKAYPKDLEAELGQAWVFKDSRRLAGFSGLAIILLDN
jgi:hypothetical protein